MENDQKQPEVTRITRTIETIDLRLLRCMFTDLLARHGGTIVLSCDSIARAGQDYAEVRMEHDNHSGLVCLKLIPK